MKEILPKEIEKYTTPIGKTRYRFKIYAGKDELTGYSKQIRKQGFKSKEQVLKAYQEEIQRIALGQETNKKKRYTIESFYNEIWLPSYQGTVKPSSLNTVKEVFKKHINRDAGKIFIDRFDSTIATKLVQNWSKSLSKSLYIQSYTYLNNLLNYAVQLDYINKNYLAIINKPKCKITKPTKDTKTFYTKDELTSFLSTVKEQGTPKAYTLFYLLAYTGIRIGECTALSWNDIDLYNNELTINKTVTRDENKRLIIGNTPKTIAGNRIIPLGKSTVNILKEWELQQIKEKSRLGMISLDPTCLVFPNRKGNILADGTVRSWIHKYSKLAKLKPINVHGFRHTHGSLLYESTKDAKAVQMRLGHSKIYTTMNVYVHDDDQQKKITAEKFENFMQN